MAYSVNKVILVGALGKDPEIRTTQAGDKIANLTVATSESWKDRASGERKEKTEWHRVTVFNDVLAEVCERHFKKGSKVYVEGSLQTRKWVDKNGAEKFTTEILITKYKGEIIDVTGKSDGGNNGGGRSAQREAPAQQASKHAPRQNDLDDDIPF